MNDETSGHVDNLCCFVHPGVVALTWTDDPQDTQYEISQDALDRLSHAKDAHGKRLEIVKIHQPGPLYSTAEESQGVDVVEGSAARKPGDHLAGSYINFYIANGGVIAPLYNDSHDQEALATFKRLFPDREVVGLEAREILLRGGNIHCITQQQPIGRSHPLG